MRRLRVYADTSVFGGVLDEEFSEASSRFFDGVRAGRFVVLVSEVTYRELEAAPAEVRRVISALPREGVLEVPADDEVEALAEAYVAAGVLGHSSIDDARHVATASVAEADLIVSWNFRHIVNRKCIREFNAVNALRGYRPIEIYSPLEVGYED